MAGSALVVLVLSMTHSVGLVGSTNGHATLLCRAGFVHRDVKAGNILLAPGVGQVCSGGHRMFGRNRGCEGRAGAGQGHRQGKAHLTSTLCCDHAPQVRLADGGIRMHIPHGMPGLKLTGPLAALTCGRRCGWPTGASACAWRRQARGCRPAGARCARRAPSAPSSGARPRSSR